MRALLTVWVDPVKALDCEESGESVFPILFAAGVLVQKYVAIQYVAIFSFEKLFGVQLGAQKVFCITSIGNKVPVELTLQIVAVLRQVNKH